MADQFTVAAAKFSPAGESNSSNEKAQQQPTSAENSTGLQVAPLHIQPRQPPPPEPVFGALPSEPTQEAAEGIRFDYCDGLRVLFPKTGEYRLVMRDGDTGTCVYDAEIRSEEHTSELQSP